MTPEQLDMEARSAKADIYRFENLWQEEVQYKTALSYCTLAQIYNAMGNLLKRLRWRARISESNEKYWEKNTIAFIKSSVYFGPSLLCDVIQFHS